jgi:hypothetical protein
MVCILGAQTGNADLIKTCYTCWTDFIAAWYSVTKSGLLSNDQFCFPVTYSVLITYEKIHAFIVSAQIYFILGTKQDKSLVVLLPQMGLLFRPD